MGKLKTTLLLLFFVAFFYSNATDSTIRYTLVKTINGLFKDFTIDPLGNIFVVNKNNQVKKYNVQFDSIAQFNDIKRYGNISLIDASNPLKILLYFNHYNTILITDRFLNVRNTIDCRKQNILKATVIATSFDNNVWIFDELDATLKKINDEGKIIFKTADCRLLFEDFCNPQKIIDANGSIYLYCDKNGWIVLDYYGTLQHQYKLINWEDVQVINKILIGRVANKLVLSKPNELFEKSLTTNIELKNCIKLIQQKDKIFVLTKQGMEVYAEY